MNENTFRPKAGGAVAEILAQDGELDRIMEQGLVFDAPPPAPPPGPPPLSIRELMSMDGPPDFRALADEREAQDRQPDPEPVQADPPPEPAPPRPAPRRGWRRKTPFPQPREQR